MTKPAEPISARRLLQPAAPTGQGRRLATAVPPSETMPESPSDAAIGFDRGYADGQRTALAQVEAQVAQLQRAWQTQAQVRLDEALSETASARERYLDAAKELAHQIEQDRRWAEGMAVELALQAVVALLGTKLADRDLVLALCQQAYANSSTPPNRLRVAAADYPEIAAKLDGLDVLADPVLPTGSCMLDTGRGSLDAGIELRLQLLCQAFLEALQEPAR